MFKAFKQDGVEIAQSIRMFPIFHPVRPRFHGAPMRGGKFFMLSAIVEEWQVHGLMRFGVFPNMIPNLQDFFFVMCIKRKTLFGNFLEDRKAMPQAKETRAFLSKRQVVAIVFRMMFVQGLFDFLQMAAHIEDIITPLPAS